MGLRAGSGTPNGEKSSWDYSLQPLSPFSLLELHNHVLKVITAEPRMRATFRANRVSLGRGSRPNAGRSEQDRCGWNEEWTGDGRRYHRQSGKVYDDAFS
jgi:hypothetical protein